MRSETNTKRVVRRSNPSTSQGMGDKVPYHMVVNFVDTLFNCAGTVKEERRASLQVAKS